MKGSLVVAHGNKRGSFYMIADEDMILVVEVGNNSFFFCIRGLGI